MVRYLLHIGPHKTGSTYLQVLFKKLAPELRQRGIIYPVHWEYEFAPGHFPLTQRLLSEADGGLENEFRELSASHDGTILLSAEDFSGLSLQALTRLKGCLGGHEVRVVFYCRRWLDLLPSSWQEMVKHGHKMNLPEFSTYHLINPFASNIINYGVTLDRFEKAFGAENISLVSYDHVVDGGGDIGEHFFRTFLSWPDVPLVADLRPNTSFTIPDIEMIRAMNAIEWERRQTRSYHLRVRYLSMKARLDLVSVFDAMNRHIDEIRVNERSPALRALHDQIFQKYGSRLVAPGSDSDFFVQKQGVIRFVHQDYLLVEGVYEALKASYHALQA